VSYGFLWTFADLHLTGGVLRLSDRHKLCVGLLHLGPIYNVSGATLSEFHTTE